MNLSILNRIRLYFNYGGIGFLLILFLLNATDEVLMILIPMVFNIVLWRRLTVSEFKKSRLVIALIAGLLTTGVFLIQYNYRQFIDWSCIRRISDLQANVSYILNMILFSAVIWEIGLWTSRKRIEIKI